MRIVILALLACAGPQLACAVGVDDLPLVETPAAQSTLPRLMLFLSGDGGWAALDKTVVDRIAQSGISVIGLNSRKYFWVARTPETATRDVERILRHYLQVWHKTDIALAGYSFGADVLPVIVNRLPADLQAKISSISLISLGRDVTWEVHALDWVPGLAAVGDPLDAQLASLPSVPLLCLYGAGEDSLCSSLGASRAIVGTVGKGHHFGGDYDEIADRVLEFSRAPKAP
ncbi:MAG: AcvB/VirJ family lysyl-phosphatidylglycerol hydrolase [Pseudomonadota bacterium]